MLDGFLIREFVCCAQNALVLSMKCRPAPPSNVVRFEPVLDRVLSRSVEASPQWSGASPQPASTSSEPSTPCLTSPMKVPDLKMPPGCPSSFADIDVECVPQQSRKFCSFFCILNTFHSFLTQMVGTLLKALIEISQNLQKNLKLEQNSSRQLSFPARASTART